MVMVTTINSIHDENNRAETVSMVMVTTINSIHDDSNSNRDSSHGDGNYNKQYP